MKACSHCLGHMTKVATMPIYGKTLYKSSSLESKSRWPWNLVCSPAYWSTTYTTFVYMMPRVDLDLFYGKIKFGPVFFYKVKTMDFSKTIVLYDIQVCRCSQLKWVHEALWVLKVINLNPVQSDSIFLNFFSSVTADFNISSALRWAIMFLWLFIYRYP